MKKLYSKLHYLNPNNIEFDINNPRGLTEEQIVTSPHFDKLLDSIREHGIIEPLIVKPADSKTKTYMLIDGERRLRAAQIAKVKKVPARFAKDDTDGRILAYHAHMLRENWDKAAETKAIKRIIQDIRTDNPDITDAEIKKELTKITAHKTHELATILKLINYSDKTIDKIISKKLHKSYPVEIESNFIAPLRRRFPEIIDKYGIDKLRDVLIQKALDGHLVDTRFLMVYFRVVFSDIDINAKYKTKISELLVNFLDYKDKSIRETLREYEELTKTKSQPTLKTTKEIDKNKKAKTEEEITIEGTQELEKFHYKAIKVTRKNITTIADIRGKIEQAGKTLSGEENEYISEALLCLEKNCLKAATLMIWSTGISRILGYINKDLIDFNNASQSMKQSPKSVWRHHAKNFMNKADSTEDIRENNKDVQLLCYLTYKGIISATQFEKLYFNYKTRNHCAHPTDIQLTANEIISIFENVYNLILNNTKLR